MKRSALANDSKYGLHSAVMGTDLERARRVASQLRAGRVVINNMTDDPQAPWGGFKYSGVGREYGKYGIEAFLEPKAILSNRSLPNEIKDELMSKHVSYLPKRSRGPTRYPGTGGGLCTLCRSSRCERSDGAFYRRHTLRGLHEPEGSASHHRNCTRATRWLRCLLI